MLAIFLSYLAEHGINIHFKFEPAWTWEFFLIQLLPLVMSVFTIWMSMLAGSMKPYAWALGLVNQLFWSVWIWYSGNHNFIFMNLALWVVYFRNNWKWMRRKPVLSTRNSDENVLRVGRRDDGTASGDVRLLNDQRHAP